MSAMPRILAFAAGAMLIHAMGSMVAARQAAVPLALVPRPMSVVQGDGAFTITASTPIVADPALRPQARQFASLIAPATGFALEVGPGPAPASAHIAFVEDRALDARLGGEGYRLEITPRALIVRAAAPAGAFYAIQTIRQLLPAAVFREAAVANVDWRVPVVTIEDRPRFAWRGGMLDAARYFMPKEFVKKYIDLLALHKMNRFHWHLTDDQGWRLQVKQYPKLTQVAAWRKETLIGHSRALARAFDGRRHGGFYTQDDVREIVAYAAERFVTIVPEIEMPGHSQAIIAAYPELGSTDQPVEVGTSWGVAPYLLNADPSTIGFMQNILTEVLDLFPSPWIHVGGDEAVKTQWQANPRIQARIRELGLKDESELQSWFIRQMDAFLTSHGRRLIGWDEILEGGLAENATVMSWRGIEGGIAAARAGHDVVLTPREFTYFDYYQSADHDKEPLAIGGLLPLDKVSTWEPMPEALEPQYHAHILGIQGQLWSEYLPNPKAVEYMAFPRMAALAEVAWTPAAERHLDDFHARLPAHLERLRVLDVNFRAIDR
jgi:hexosaminidase